VVVDTKALIDSKNLNGSESAASQSILLTKETSTVPKNKKWLTKHRRKLADRDHIILELKPIIRKLKHFPSDAELKRLKRSDLCHSIAEEHGGFVKFQISLGLRPRKKTGSASLSNKENFTKELGDFREKLGHFPTKKDFFENDRVDLYAAAPLHGGLDKLRAEAGLTPAQLRGENSLSIFENYTREIGIIWQQIGHFPSWGELEELERQDLLNAARYHDGITGIRKKMKAGLLVRIGDDSLKNKEVFDKELAEYLTSKDGELPSWKEIAKENGMLAWAITNYHGGMNKLRESLGMELKLRTGPYSLSIPCNFFKELNRICKILGHFPSDDELKGRGIYRHTTNFGGLPKLKMGYYKDQIESLLLQGRLPTEIAHELGVRKKLVEERRKVLFSPENLPDLVSTMHQNNFSIMKITKRIGREAKIIFQEAKSGDELAFNLLFVLYKPIINRIASRFVANSSTADKINYLKGALFEIVKRRKDLPRKSELVKLLNVEMIKMAREEAVSWVSIDTELEGSGRLIDFVDTESKIRLGNLRRR
jgi:hypothetical protein